MRDVDYGWLVATCTPPARSAFFVVVYLHMPWPDVWQLPQAARTDLDLRHADLPGADGRSLLRLLLPWGQMSFWGAQVIVNIFSAIPFIGPDLAGLDRGDYAIGDATLNRFFAFHVIALPLVLLGLVVAHLIALHETRLQQSRRRGNQ